MLLHCTQYVPKKCFKKIMIWYIDTFSRTEREKIYIFFDPKVGIVPPVLHIIKLVPNHCILAIT